MLAYAIGGLTILIGLVLLARWFVSAEPKDILRAARRAAVIVGVLFVVYMAVAGRWQLLPALLFLALPWFNRMNLLRTMAKNKAGPTPGQTSDVETGYLRMTLDHDTGNMSGEVLAGSFAGARVEELALADLIRLRDECARADEPSVVVLESYMDRQFGPEWRDGDMSGGDAGGPMTVDEAYEILGLEPGVGSDDIERAYRQLMKKLHPDHGGSDYLAAKINQAKDLLLSR